MAAQRSQVEVSFVRDDALDPYEPRLALRGRIIAQGVMLLVIVLVVYAMALRGSFIFVDDQTIGENGLLRSFRGLGPIWIHPTILPHYQPLAYSAWLIEFKLFSTRLAGGYLAVNALLHACNVILLWTLLRKLEVPGALAAAALFAVHPINVEAVAWISQQPTLLCGVFYFSTLLIYLRYCGINPQPPIEGSLFELPTSPRALYWTAIGLMLAALTSHAAAVTLPVVLVIVVWWERGKLTKADLRPILPLAALSLLWTVVIAYADARHAAITNAETSPGILTRIAIAGRAVWVYLVHLAAPINLAVAYPNWSISQSFLWLLPVVAVLAVAWIVRPKVGRAPFAAASMLLAVLLPAFLFRSDLDGISYVADHLVYFAAAVFTVAVVGALAGPLARVRPHLGGGVAVAFAAMFAVGTVMREVDYSTAEALWSAALRADAGSVAAHNHLGLIELETNKDSVAAMNHFQVVLEREPENVQALINIAKVHEANANQTENVLDRAAFTRKAMQRYQDAILIQPDNAEAHFGLAENLRATGNSEQALAEYETALRLRPDYLNAYHGLGCIHMDRGEWEPATEAFKKAMQLNPAYLPAYLSMANLQFRQGLHTEAAATLEQLLKIDPNNFLAYMYAGQMARELALKLAKDESERSIVLVQAERFFKKAIELRPKIADAHFMAGLTLLDQEKLDEAVFQFSKAVEINPNSPEMKARLEQTKRMLDEKKVP